MASASKKKEESSDMITSPCINTHGKSGKLSGARGGKKNRKGGGEEEGERRVARMVAEDILKQTSNTKCPLPGCDSKGICFIFACNIFSFQWETRLFKYLKIKSSQKKTSSLKLFQVI